MDFGGTYQATTDPMIDFRRTVTVPAGVGGGASWVGSATGYLVAVPRLSVGGQSIDAIGGVQNLPLESEADPVVLTPAVAPVPPAPSRDAVLAARVGFQGLTVQTQQFGAIRAWGPELGSLTDADANSYVQQAMQAGWSAVEFAVSWKYSGPTFQYPVPGSDLSQNLPELRRRVKQAIATGSPIGLKAVYLFCAGDGESVNANPQPGQYNDPVGWTYGRTWLMQNFPRIYAAFGPQPDDPTDLRGWMVFHGGYDGCDAYQWVSGQNVADWWHLLRQTLDTGGAGYAGYEWSAGQCQLGDDFPTYTPGNAGCIDLWLLELPPGPYPPTDDQSIRQITQQLGRMCRPYNRPSWAVDDPSPPYYGPFNTPRGPAPVQVFEFDTYTWVRNMSAAQVEADRSVLRGIVPGTVIC